jgi:hypothetical protein
MFSIGDRVRLTRKARDELDGSYPPRGEVLAILRTKAGQIRFRLRMDPDKWGMSWELDFAFRELERETKAA